MNRIISISFLAFICLSSMCLFVVALIIWMATILFDKRLKLLHLFSSFWASIYIWMMPAWSVEVKGKKHINKKTTYVITSNHQSLLDILVAFRLFFHFKWVSKAEIFRIPFIGWNMHLNRYIALRRGDKASIQQMFDDCNTSISQGNSVFMFPEGTRSKNRQLKAFKPGAFILAKDNHVPILPIAISGTREALPKHSLNFHGKNPIIVEVLPEISSEIVDQLSVEDLSDRVHADISRQVMNNYRIIDANTV